MHIVKTWGRAKETIEYLKFNKYREVKHLIGKYYYCKKIGNQLIDVEIIR